MRKQTEEDFCKRKRIIKYNLKVYYTTYIFRYVCQKLLSKFLHEMKYANMLKRLIKLFELQIHYACAKHGKRLAINVAGFAFLEHWIRLI